VLGGAGLEAAARRQAALPRLLRDVGDPMRLLRWIRAWRLHRRFARVCSKCGAFGVVLEDVTELQDYCSLCAQPEIARMLCRRWRA
jgi:hypothetical protein